MDAQKNFEQYYVDACFPISQLESKLRDQFYPYTRIDSKAIQRKDKRNRLHLQLSSKHGDRKSISLLLSVEYPPLLVDGKRDNTTPPKFYINTQSFNNVVEALERLKLLEHALDNQLKSQTAFSTNPDDATLEVIEG